MAGRPRRKGEDATGSGGGCTDGPRPPPLATSSMPPQLQLVGLATAAIMAAVGFFWHRKEEEKKTNGKGKDARGVGKPVEGGEAEKRGEEAKADAVEVRKIQGGPWRARPGVSGLPPPLPPPPPPLAPPPLTGLTYAVKDCFSAPGVVSSFGSRRWRETHPPNTTLARALKLLQESGATGGGWAVMDALAFSLEGTTGFSDLDQEAEEEAGKYTSPHNTRYPALVVGGSSSGSAAAVASGEVDFAIGTDTAGSVRAPSACCGLYGLRPTHGAISTEGLIPMSQSLDTVGCFARNAATLSAVAYALLGDDARGGGGVPGTERLATRVLVPEEVLSKSEETIKSSMTCAIQAARSVLGQENVSYFNLSQALWENEEFRNAATLFMEERLANFPKSPAKPGRQIVWQAIVRALRAIQGAEFWDNHGDWICENRDALPRAYAERIAVAERTNIGDTGNARLVRKSLKTALGKILEPGTLLLMPTLTIHPAARSGDEQHTATTYRATIIELFSLCSLSGAPQACFPIRSSSSHRAASEGKPSVKWEPSASLVGRPGSDLVVIDTVVAIDKPVTMAVDNAVASLLNALRASSAEGDNNTQTRGAGQKETKRRIEVVEGKSATAPSTARAKTKKKSEEGEGSSSSSSSSDAAMMSASEKEKGNAAFALKNYTLALSHYTAALDLNPRNPALYNNRALTHLKLGQFELAEMDCNRTIKLDTKNAKAYLRRAFAKSIQGRLPEALDDYEKVLVLEPNNREAQDEIERMRAMALATAPPGAELI